MTVKFIKEFKKLNKCLACSKDRVDARSFCAFHLAKARIKWRKRREERRAQGLCCFCDNKNLNGWLRCKTHAKINLLRIREWIKAHPNHYREQWEKKKKIRDAGFCISCKEHRPLPLGFKRCDHCRERRKNPVNIEEFK